jgi:thiol-disulfide isomerase/thioredoxin
MFQHLGRAAGIAALGLAAAAGSALAEDLEVGDRAPAMTVDEWIKGSEVTSFEPGRAYVVEFWATWCGPCVANIPHLTELQEKYPDVAIIGVAGYERSGKDKLNTFMADGKGRDMGYTVAYDADGSMGKAWMDAAGQNGIPTAFLVDKAGKVAFIGSPAALEDEIRKVAGQPSRKQAEKKAEKPAAPEVTLTVGDKAPEMKVTEWVKGDEVTSFEKGKVYVVEFWATWCGPCKVSIPHLTEVQKKYEDKNVEVIGVSIWESNGDYSKVEPFVEEFGDKMDYNVAYDDSKTMEKTWMAAAGRNGIPSAFIVDQEGRIAWIGHPMSKMDEALEKVVNKTWNIEEARREQARALEEARAQREQMAARQELMSKIAPRLQAFQTAIKENDAEAANLVAKELIEGPGGEDAMTMNTVAWLMVDPEGAFENPDLDLALKAATKADKLAESKDPAIMDTLAMVHYKKGDFARALKLQTRAAELAKGTQFEEEINGRLEQFKAEEAKRRG